MPLTYHYTKYDNSFLFRTIFIISANEEITSGDSFSLPETLSLSLLSIGQIIKLKLLFLKKNKKSRNDFLSNLSPDDSFLWHIKKKLNNYILIPPLTAFNSIAHTDTAEILAKIYAEQFSPNLSLASPDHIYHFNNTVNNLLATSYPWTSFWNSVYNYLYYHRKSKKA